VKNKNKILILFAILLTFAGFFGLYFDCSADNSSVMINELMWMGSSVSTADEWIELKNLIPF